MFLTVLAGCSECPTEAGDDGVIWVVEGRGFNVAPSADAATVYFGGIAHDVVAVEKATGRLRWRATTGVSGPWTTGYNTVVAADVVALGDVDVHAFDRATGERRWTFAAADLDETGHGVLAVDGETIFAGSLKNRVYAIDARTGEQRWMTQLPGHSESASYDPAVRDGAVFVGIKRFGIPTTGALAALDGETGEIRWVREFEGSYEGALYGCLGGAVFHDSRVIVAVEDGRIYGLDRQTGEIEWTAPRVHALPPDPHGAYADTRPLEIVGDIVVAGSTQGTVVGLDATTGAERWRRQGFYYVGVRYATDQRMVYVTADGLNAIDPATGAVRWRRGAAGVGDDGVVRQSLFISPALPEADRLFVSGGAGFYALRN